MQERDRQNRESWAEAARTLDRERRERSLEIRRLTLAAGLKRDVISLMWRRKMVSKRRNYPQGKKEMS